MHTAIGWAGHTAGKYAIRAAVILGFVFPGANAFAQNTEAPHDALNKESARQDAPAKNAPSANSNEPGYVLEENPDKFPDTTNQCIFFRTLYDWRALNNSNLIVWAPSRKHPYHLQLDRPCFGLRFAHSIGFTSRDSRLCGFGGDSVLVESGGGRPDRCPIGSITKLTEESLKALLDQAPGKKSDDKKSDDKATGE